MIGHFRPSSYDSYSKRGIALVSVSYKAQAAGAIPLLCQLKDQSHVQFPDVIGHNEWRKRKVQGSRFSSILIARGLFSFDRTLDFRSSAINSRVKQDAGVRHGVRSRGQELRPLRGGNPVLPIQGIWMFEGC